MLEPYLYSILFIPYWSLLSAVVCGEAESDVPSRILVLRKSHSRTLAENSPSALSFAGPDCLRSCRLVSQGAKAKEAGGGPPVQHFSTTINSWAGGEDIVTTRSGARCNLQTCHVRAPPPNSQTSGRLHNSISVSVLALLLTGHFQDYHGLLSSSEMDSVLFCVFALL